MAFLAKILGSLPIALASSFVSADEINFATIRDLLNRNDCFRCHFSGTTRISERIPLNDRTLMIRLKIVVPNKSEESSLYLRVTAEDEQMRMPPPRSGIPALSQDDRDVIRKWIDAGARE